MEQTPAHEHHNPELLQAIPTTARRLIEIGCSAGALAREFKKVAPHSDYLGVEVDAGYAKLAERYCDRSVVLDIERADEAFWADNADRDCWIFGDTLEHLVDPWAVLTRIRARIPAAGCVVACIPNAQHWSVQARLSIGDFRYAQEGLLDKTHLRWFTRQTILELFDQTGFLVANAVARISENEPHRDRVLPVIEQMARQLEVDPQVAVSDALPLQYVVRAVPKP
ncbi:MAG TPA: methyltransferase domain-containing protein [Burkholderiales bacterium]|nr:methyltransferase domain-containing protein [Burkholderiales bacterium]